jgi:large subunit ribosomal protein L1
MPRHGKKFREAQARVPEGQNYSVPEAVSLVKELSFAKFDETVEAAVRLGVDPRHADQIVRGAVVLPHGTGKTARVLVIAQGDRRARRRKQAPISSAWSTSRRSRTAGWTSTWPWPRRT